MEAPRWQFIIRASGFCALIAITLSSLLFVLLAPPHGLRNAVVGFGNVWLLAAIPAGFFGSVAGALGGGWFSLRRGRITSLSLLLVEAATVGALLSLVVSLFLSVLDVSERPHSHTKESYFFLAIGCSTAIVFAYCFRRAILAGSQSCNPR